MDRSPLPPSCAARFAWERVLASGGFGAVHLCTQAHLGRKVVVKLLHGDTLQDAEQVARFLDEARMAASIEHPNVVRVIDSDAGDVPWIAYEYVPGQNLRQLLGAGRVTLEVAVRATLHVLAALSAAHARQIVHRDVKPENVLEAGGGVFKVTDFGIAKWTRDRGVRTKTGIVLGTPAYMAPELIRGEAIGAPADLYSAGAMLFELLTGRPPFHHDSPILLLELHLTAQVPELPPEVRDRARGLQPVVQRALAKTPAERYATAAQMQADLARLEIAHTPAGLPAMRGGAASGATRPAGVAAPAASAGWRATVAQAWRSSGSFAKRTRWAVGAGALLVLAGLVWAAIAHRPPADLRAEVHRLARETEAVAAALAPYTGRKVVKRRLKRQERDVALGEACAAELARRTDEVEALRRLARRVDRLGPYVLRSSRLEEVQLPFCFALKTLAHFAELGARGDPPMALGMPKPGEGWLPPADRHWMSAVVAMQALMVDAEKDLVGGRAAAARRLLPPVDLDALDEVGDDVIAELIDQEGKSGFARARGLARDGGDTGALRDAEAFLRLALAHVEHLVRARRPADAFPADVVAGVLQMLRGAGSYDSLRRRLGDESSCLIDKTRLAPGRLVYREKVLARRVKLWVDLFAGEMTSPGSSLTHQLAFAETGAEFTDLAHQLAVEFAVPKPPAEARAWAWVHPYLAACRGKHEKRADQPIQDTLKAAAELEACVNTGGMTHAERDAHVRILLRFLHLLDEVHEHEGKTSPSRLDASHRNHDGCCRIVDETILRLRELGASPAGRKPGLIEPEAIARWNTARSCRGRSGVDRPRR